MDSDRRLQKKNNSGYFECHHIIPKCMGGTDDLSNLVYLTPKEHFICHRLLYEMYPKNYKLLSALIKMTLNSKGQARHKISSRTYAAYITEYRLYRKGKTFDELFGIEKATEIKARLRLNSYSKGKKWKDRLSPECRNALIEKIKKSTTGKANPRTGKTWEEYYGKDKAGEIKIKASERQTGNKNHMYGKKLSPETIAKRTLTRKLKKELDPEYGNRGDTTKEKTSK